MFHNVQGFIQTSQRRLLCPLWPQGHSKHTNRNVSVKFTVYGTTTQFPLRAALQRPTFNTREEADDDDSALFLILRTLFTSFALLPLLVH